MVNEGVDSGNLPNDSKVTGDGSVPKIVKVELLLVEQLAQMMALKSQHFHRM